jgi:DNA anti-recombination protein RmuC
MVEEHQITKEAKEAALAIMQQAKEESQALINASKLKANEIADKAERWSNDMRRNASAYVENVIKDTDETLTRSVNDIRTLRQSLHDALNAPSEPRPDFD